MKTIYSLTLLLFGISSFAQDKYASASEEVAFDGNDLVAYFTSEEAVPGLEKYTHYYDGLKLQFSSQENLDKFKSNPVKYLPEYGGWCAIALTHGSWVRPDFSRFKVQDNKLLFFEVRAFWNGKTEWEKDPDINKIVADKKFEELSKEN